MPVNCRFTPYIDMPSVSLYTPKSLIIVVAFVALVLCSSCSQSGEHIALYHLPDHITVTNVKAVRAANNDVVIQGSTNLPDGTKIGVELVNNRRYPVQDWNVLVASGNFRSAGLRVGTSPLARGKQKIHILSVFNPNWQSEDILSLVGANGTKLNASEVIRSQDPQMIDSNKSLDYTLSLSIPPVIGAAPQKNDPIQIVKNTTLTVDGKHSRFNVDDEVRQYLDTSDDLRMGSGWSATPVGRNKYNVVLDFINKSGNTRHHSAIWEVDSKTKQVFYRNRNAKVISSYSPFDGIDENDPQIQKAKEMLRDMAPNIENPR
jgi:hypothetical protein